MTADRTPRQLELMAAGAELFADQGYVATGIDDLAGRLGLTGPAFYRHFPTKEALLVAILERLLEARLERAREATEGQHDPGAALHALVVDHVRHVLDERPDFLTWQTQKHGLPAADLHRLQRLDDRHTEEWARHLRLVRPDLAPEVARVTCCAALGLARSLSEVSTPMRTAELEDLVTEMVTRVLLG